MGKARHSVSVTIFGKKKKGSEYIYVLCENTFLEESQEAGEGTWLARVRDGGQRRGPRGGGSLEALENDDLEPRESRGKLWIRYPRDGSVDVLLVSRTVDGGRHGKLVRRETEVVGTAQGHLGWERLSAGSPRPPGGSQARSWKRAGRSTRGRSPASRPAPRPKRPPLESCSLSQALPRPPATATWSSVWSTSFFLLGVRLMAGSSMPPPSTFSLR